MQNRIYNRDIVFDPLDQEGKREFMNIEIITSPVIGGIIGLLTNNIAIKMIFKPYKEIYIGKFKLPFTPGLIPKERPRIAKAIGKVVGNELLDEETLRNALCADHVHEIFTDKFDEIMRDLSANETSLSKYAEDNKLKEKIDSIENDISTSAGIHVKNELIERKISSQLVDAAMNEVMKKLNPLLMTMASGAISAAKQPLTEKLDEMIEANCPEIVDEFISIKYQQMLNTQVKDVAAGVDGKVPHLGEMIWNAYVGILNEKAKGFLGALNISKVVEDKINEYDIEEFERLILEISKKELNAVVWLGGLLGMVMGFINLLF